MSCFIKLEDGKFIQWSKSSDSPASNVLSMDEMIREINEICRVMDLLGTPSRLSSVEIVNLVLTTGTSDPSGSVTLGVILEYNRAGKGETQLNLSEILRDYR